MEFAVRLYAKETPLARLNRRPAYNRRAMKRILGQLLILAALPLAPAFCQAKAPVQGSFLHHVYFWLAEPDSAAARKEFLTELNRMRAIPGIRFSFIGTPAADPRDVVDNSYTYYWLVSFDDKAAWKVYDQHPIHDGFRKKSSLWKKVVVYDTQQVK
jgi:hypothetical protein